MTGPLSNDEFFLRLADLFEDRRKKDHGSVYLTQTRLSYQTPLPTPTPSTPFPDLIPTGPLRILIRATDGKSKAHRDEKIKISTVVTPDTIEGFYTRYAEVCKAGMSGLKKRDRSKAKAKMKAKKKAGGEEKKV